MINDKESQITTLGAALISEKVIIDQLRAENEKLKIELSRAMKRKCKLCDCIFSTDGDLCSHIQAFHNENCFKQEINNYKEKMDNLVVETNDLKNIIERYSTDNRDIKIVSAKEKLELSNVIDTQNVEKEKLDKTHRILKDLYEKQNTKYFNLLETKEALEETIQKKENELKRKNSLCNSCPFCKKNNKTGQVYKTHIKTVYSKEC